MNQDQLINWMYNHFDAEAYLESKRNGAAFAYLANVSQQLMANAGVVQPQRVNRPATRPVPAVQRNDEPQDLTGAPRQVQQEDEAPARPTAPVRRQAARNAVANDGDRVRVATL